MPSPIYNDASGRLLESLTGAMPHALLLTGAEGVGLGTVATQLAGKQLEMIVQPTDREGNLDPSGKGIIRAKQIRELVERAITKTTSTRYYLIDDADLMNQTAQNAFLKLLEEPTEDTHFILTAHHPHRLLPTVRSRVQTIMLDPISQEQSELLLTRLKVLDQTQRQQMLFLANGLPDELTRLATDAKYFAASSAAIRDARTLLQGGPVEQVNLVEAYQANRAGTLDLITAAQRILQHSLYNAPDATVIAKADELATTYDRIAANGNIRLQLMSFLV